jgi:hypothetical protein
VTSVTNGALADVRDSASADYLAASTAIAIAISPSAHSMALRLMRRNLLSPLGQSPSKPASAAANATGCRDGVRMTVVSSCSFRLVNPM